MQSSAVSEVVGQEQDFRLTRRGRVVVSMLAMLLLAVVAYFGINLTASKADAVTAASNPKSFEYVVMQPGSSLWDVAMLLDNERDPRDLVQEIAELNQLGGTSVEAGQPIAVPTRYNGHPLLQTSGEVGL